MGIHWINTVFLNLGGWGLKRIMIYLVIVVIVVPFIYLHTAEAAKKVIPVPIISQFPQLPTGCEATALTMILQWGGISVKKQDVANRLPKGIVPNFTKKPPKGANPNHAFVGNPYSRSGFGVFEKPIIKVMNSYVPGSSVNLTGSSFTQIEKLVNQGYPVMAWITIGLKPTYVSRVWYDPYGNKVNWLIHEHAVVIVGYTPSTIIVNDPYTGKRQSYNRDVFIKRWEQMGKRAVTMKPSRSTFSEGGYQTSSTGFLPKVLLLLLFILIDYWYFTKSFMYLALQKFSKASRRS